MDDVRLQVWQRTIRARPRRAALNALNTVLRRNEIAIVVADEYRDERGIPVPLFGGNVNARRGPATLALRTGAAIVPALLVRQPDDSLKLIIEPELELARAGKSKDDVHESTLRITQWLERTVRAYPDQWNWTNIQWQDGFGGTEEKGRARQPNHVPPGIGGLSRTCQRAHSGYEKVFYQARACPARRYFRQRCHPRGHRRIHESMRAELR